MALVNSFDASLSSVTRVMSPLPMTSFATSANVPRLANTLSPRAATLEFHRRAEGRAGFSHTLGTEIAVIASAAGGTRGAASGQAEGEDAGQGEGSDATVHESSSVIDGAVRAERNACCACCLAWPKPRLWPCKPPVETR